MSIIGYYFRIKKISGDPNAVAKFSVREITGTLVNLLDAKRELSSYENFWVNRLYTAFRERKSKLSLNFKEFMELHNKLIAHFDLVAPYYKFSGNPNLKITVLLEGGKTDFRRRAKMLLDNYEIFNDKWFELHQEFYEIFHIDKELD